MCYVTTVSSKGQVVIPKTIREQLNLESGRPLVVFSDGSNILLKPIPPTRHFRIQSTHGRYCCLGERSRPDRRRYYRCHKDCQKEVNTYVSN